jgi:hypothetical protein
MKKIVYLDNNSDLIYLLDQIYPSLNLKAASISLPIGWFFIANEMCKEISNDSKNTISCIKEKFASLRCYAYNTHSMLDETQSCLRRIETQSCLTCQICGSTNDVKINSLNSGWMYRICQSCL